MYGLDDKLRGKITEASDSVAEKVVAIELSKRVRNNNGYVTRVLLDAQRREAEEDCRYDDQGHGDAGDDKYQDQEKDEAVEGDHGDTETGLDGAEGHETQVQNEEEEAGCATWWESGGGGDGWYGESVYQDNNQRYDDNTAGWYDECEDQDDGWDDEEWPEE